MLRNYLSLAWRHIEKNTVFSVISIFGLAVGMAAFLLILQYAIFETRYDKFNEHANDIYRIATHTYENGHKVYQSASSSPLIGPLLEEKLPEIIRSARLVSTRSWFQCALSYTKGGNTITFNESQLYYADPAVLSVFSFSLKQGDKSSALEKPYSAVLSLAAAKRYFGEENAIGKVLRLKGSFEENDYTVTAIMSNFPADSHLDPDILLSISSIEHHRVFEKFGAYTYVHLAPEINPRHLTAKLSELVSTYLPGLTDAEAEKEVLELQPLTDIYLYSSLEDEIKAGGNANAVYLLLVIAFFILGIAWVNYINLAVSRSISRAKEVGIRKVSGANSSQLVYQFLTESIVVNLMGAALAVCLVRFLSPLFYEITGFPISYSRLAQFGLSSTGLFIVSIICAGIVLSGLYPAKVLSAHNPALVLKGKFSGKKGRVGLQKALVVFQFTCAIGLAVAVITFNKQFRFIQSQDLGIDISKTLVVKAPDLIDSTYAMQLTGFKSTLEQQAIVNSVTTSSSIPGEKIEWIGDVRKGQDKSGPRLNFIINVVDQDFISSYRLDLLAGRNFVQSDFPGEKFGEKTEPVILNKTAVGQLGFDAPADVIGTYLFWGDNQCRVVGVINDFRQRSLKNALQPTLFTANNGPMLTLKLGKAVPPDNLKQSIEVILEAWNTFFPENPFDYFFLEDFYAKQYLGDRQLMNLFSFFCGLAVFISCLGLFGISLYTMRQRTREISIRKVLGAPSLNLLVLLTKEFLLVIVIASFFAIPVSYLGVEKWLQGFVLQIDLNGWIFVIPVLCISAVAFFTISMQTFKTIRSNPAEILKEE